MLFQRRHPPHWFEVLRVALWPRRSWVRSGKYFAKRVLRLTASPHAIAAGIAAGALASFTPFIGFHFIIAFVIAYIIGGNMLAAALGTSVGNPLTFPFIWASTYRLGTWILSGTLPAHQSNMITESLFEHSIDTIMPILKPMLLGSAILGIIAGAVLYAIVYGTVRTYQATRRARLAARRNARSLALGEKPPAASEHASAALAAAVPETVVGKPAGLSPSGKLLEEEMQ
ncbi:DUF2062 domain-containing protein [Breoghania sp. L-A4]|uniref:DUF2062 domain-containing protein n=1 Tax=Breoghania sp. L-A4 TaxID=2304600 RepID=UPI000E35E6A1|nr:DUF2062 domain-containing protein [Breoghania sp. L-A4]AXS40245.1 DUF2062 domain-containing protein [Breoghania sp. L-A4]